MTTQTITQIKLIPTKERESLVARLDGVAPAHARMASRAIAAISVDPDTDLPYVLRRLLALEEEVERLRAEPHDRVCFPDEQAVIHAAITWRRGITAAPWGSTAGALVAAVDRLVAGDRKPIPDGTRP